MNKWKKVKFGDVTTNFDSQRIPLSGTEREKRKGIYPYYGAQGIIDFIDNYIFDGTYLLIAEDGENLKSRKENIALLAKGAFWVNNHAHILQNNEFSDIHFLKYKINSIDISGYITGSVQPKLNKRNLNQIQFKLPPLEEQKKIAEILSALDDKIELNNRMNETLEAMAQALFKEWFVDFNFPDENGQPYKKSGGKMVSSELGMIPEGWRVESFEDVIDILGGGTPKTGIKEYWDGKIPFFTPKDVNQNYCLKTEKYVTEKGVNNCSSKLYPKNTVFITARGTVGKIALAGIDMAMNQSCYAFQGKDKFSQYLVYLQLLRLVDTLKNNTHGSVFSTITRNTFKNIKVAVSPNYLLDQITNLLAPLFEQGLGALCENETLIKTRNTLLPKLMSGEIRV